MTTGADMNKKTHHCKYCGQGFKGYKKIWGQSRKDVCSETCAKTVAKCPESESHVLTIQNHLRKSKKRKNTYRETMT